MLTTGLYDLLALGAQAGSSGQTTSGNNGGYGASIEADELKTAGTVPDIVVGGAGLTGAFGGGGSFIVSETATAMPEPASVAPLCAGVIGAAPVRLRPRRS